MSLNKKKLKDLSVCTFSPAATGSRGIFRPKPHVR